MRTSATLQAIFAWSSQAFISSKHRVGLLGENITLIAAAGERKACFFKDNQTCSTWRNANVEVHILTYKDTDTLRNRHITKWDSPGGMGIIMVVNEA